MNEGNNAIGKQRSQYYSEFATYIALPSIIYTAIFLQTNNLTSEVLTSKNF